MNGRIYRVGNNVAGNVWDLMPGNDFTPDPGVDGKLGTGDDIDQLGPAPVAAFVVGKTLADASSTPPKYVGTAQDIAIYTTFIQMK